jgi:hypothetical protein
MFSRYFEIMDACLQHRHVHFDNDLIDFRYFYLDTKRIGDCTCGIAFETTVSILRQHRLDRFCGPEWYSAVERSSNPVVQGYLAEHICLSFIVANGLVAVDPRLRRMSHASFEGLPNWDALLKSDSSLRLYTPAPYNFKAVDGVILLLCRGTKQAYMYPIQFTISMRHKKSDQEFYAEMWSEWASPIKKAGFTLESTFVWIDKKQPSDQIEPALIKTLRSREIIVHPEYRVTHVGIEQVDPRLATSLGL